MNKSDAARKQLRKLMADHKLNSVQVAELTMYKSQTIRAMMCGQRDVAPRALEMLKMKLA